MKLILYKTNMIETYRKAIKNAKTDFEKSQIPDLEQKIAIELEEIKKYEEKQDKTKRVIEFIVKDNPERVYINHLSKFILKEDMTQAIEEKELEWAEFLHFKN